MEFARRLVTLHDQEGFPLELSLEMAREQNERISLLGLLVECAKRSLPPKMVEGIAEMWAKNFRPTPAEQAALNRLGVKV